MFIQILYVRCIAISLMYFAIALNGYAQCISGYPDQATSGYALPYAVGKSYVVGQGNCTDGSHEIGFDQAYAYDFDMPIGTAITATQAGVVVELQESFVDGNGEPGKENYLIVKHDDNKVSGYYHLTKDGVMPVVGSQVVQGEVIALSGNTGDSSEPHLHFEVLECLDCDTVPINFFNTRPHTNGLVEDQSYQAEAFQPSAQHSSLTIGSLLFLLNE